MAELDFDFKSFPTTRYQGSKRKMLPWIYKNVEKLEFNTVLDVCGGSGSVSYLFKKMGKSVTYNDKLTFNHLIGKALIQNQGVLFTDEDLAGLLEVARQNPADDFIQKTFQSVYYPKKENKWLDAVNGGIINMNHYHGDILDYKKSIAYYALFQSCLVKRPFNLFHRKNLQIRTKNVERNFGNKTTWETPFEKHFTKFIKEVNLSMFDSGVECFATNQSALEIENFNYDLVYIDPPYITKNDRSDSPSYLQGYHFLEGIANYAQWPEWIDFDTKNRSFREFKDEDPFSRENITDALEELISRFRESTIVLSYKKGGVPSIETIVKIMKRYKTRVYTKSVHYQYALYKNNQDTKLNREVLIIGV